MSVLKRTLSWAAGLSLVGSMGGVALAESSDTFIPIQDPPVITITPGALYQSLEGPDAADNAFLAVDRILPTASEAVVRAGFTFLANSSDIDSGRVDASDSDQSTAFDNSSSDAIVRVAPDGSNPAGENSSSPVYRQTITVSTNGPTETIKRVGYCLINTSDTVVRANNSQFEWYDSGAANRDVTNDVERNCGFNDDDPTSVATPDTGSERAVISIVYWTSDDSFRVEGSGQHQIDDGGGDWGEATWSGNTLTVKFTFRPSHGLLKQVSGWAVRAAAQDQPQTVPNSDPGPQDFDPQLSQIYWGMSSHLEGEVTSADISNRDDWNFASVGYYGAIVSDRENVSYGTLRKDQERTVTDITTGRYIANAESDIWIEALDFESGVTGGNRLTYATDRSPGLGFVAFDCSFEDHAAGDGNSIGANPVIVSNTPAEIKNGLAATTTGNNPEQALDLNPDGMSCRLKYGGGADDASEVFTNRVIISIQDAGTYVGPFNQ